MMLNLNMLKKRKLFDDRPPMVSQDGSISTPDDEEEDTGDEQDASAQDDSEEEPDDTEPDDDADDNEATVTSNSSQPPSSRFGKLFGEAVNQPKGPLSTQLTNFLSTPPPKKEDYKIGKTNRLSAILGGASEGYQKGAGAGIKTAAQILDQPYREGLEQYGMRAKNLTQGAALEDKNLGRAASFARTAGNLTIAEGKQNIDSFRAQAQREHWKESDKQKANEGAVKGWTPHLDKITGHMTFRRPRPDGSLEILDGGKADESMPERTRRELGLAQDKDKSREKTQKSIDENRAALTGIQKNKDAAVAQQLIKDRQEAKPEAALETHRKIQNRINQIIAANGDKVKDFFKPDGTGMVGPPSDPDELKRYHKIYSAVYGGDE